MTLLFLTIILYLLPLIQSRPQQNLVGAFTTTSSSLEATTWTPRAGRGTDVILSGSNAPRLHQRDVSVARRSDPLSSVWHSDVHRLKKRGGIESSVTNRSDISYFTQLFLGTPPQKVTVQLDTGSSELWVNPDCTNVLPAERAFCETSGRYDPSASSTADTSVTSNRTIRYGIGSANITYVLDDIRLSDNSSLAIQQVQHGCAQQTIRQASGVLGLSFGKGINTNHETFLDKIAAQQGWNATIFSLVLGTKDEGPGLIVFGGVDTSKFAGPLVPLPITPPAGSSDKMARYWVTLQSVVLADPKSGTTNLTRRPTTAFLDSGSTNIYLLPEVVQAMQNVFNATKSDSNGAPIVDCSWLGLQGGFDFAFQGITINVPYRELVRTSLNQSSIPSYCYLGILPSTTISLLGASFMRSAYVTFDLSARKIYMAPYRSCGSTPISATASSDLGGLKGRCGAQSLEQASSQTLATATSVSSSATTISGWRSCRVGVLVCLAHVGTVVRRSWRPQPA